MTIEKNMFHWIIYVENHLLSIPKLFVKVYNNLVECNSFSSVLIH